MPDNNIKVLRKKTYLKILENSVGNKMFNSLFVEFQNTKEVKDILEDGEFSCAAFVSSVLYLSGAVSRACATVKSLREIFQKNDKWKKVAPGDIEAGDVLFWEKIKFENGSEAPHVGFALGKDEAVSTNYKKKAVDRHPIISGNGRKLEEVYRYSWGS